jgi:peptide/nickel transport system permease protein
VLKPPSAVHWLGTDELGRSTLSRLIHGARASLQVAFMAVILATIAGSGLGIMAAYHGGLVDMLLMRTMDLVLCLPMMILTITVVAFMGSSITNLILVIGVLYTPGTARIVYTTALSIRQSQYVQAAQAVGASALRIMMRHMLPNVIAPLLVHITLSIGFVILTESGLSFLGLGPPPPTPTWGQMISVGRNFVHRQPIPLLIPMIAVSTVILALNVLGDALRDILDPRLKGSTGGKV